MDFGSFKINSPSYNGRAFTLQKLLIGFDFTFNMDYYGLTIAYLKGLPNINLTYKAK